MAGELNKGLGFGLGAFGAITVAAVAAAPLLPAAVAGAITTSAATGTLATLGGYAAKVGAGQLVGGLLVDKYKDHKRK